MKKKHGKFPSCYFEIMPWLKDVKTDQSKCPLHVHDSVGFDVTVTRHVAVAANNVWYHKRILLNNQKM